MDTSKNLFRATGIFMVAAAFGVSGCATSGSTAKQVESVGQGKEQSVIVQSNVRDDENRSNVDAKGKNTKPGGRWLSITPLTTISTDSFQEAQNKFSDAYTRLTVTSINCSNETDAPEGCGTSNRREIDNTYKGKDMDLKYEDRFWLSRWLWGIRHTINLTSKVTVGSFTATVPLVTVDHISNRTDGEAFIRTVHHSAQNYPLFLIKGDGSNGVVTLQFEVKATDETQWSYTEVR